MGADTWDVCTDPRHHLYTHKLAVPGSKILDWPSMVTSVHSTARACHSGGMRDLWYKPTGRMVKWYPCDTL